MARRSLQGCLTGDGRVMDGWWTGRRVTGEAPVWQVAARLHDARRAAGVSAGSAGQRQGGRLPRVQRAGRRPTPARRRRGGSQWPRPMTTSVL
eukprot:1215912-Rhodomonas_salina.1